MSTVELYLIIFVLCLLLSAFFSSSETAFIAVQRVRLEHLVGTKVSGASRVSRMLERPEKLLTTILLGNNLVNTAAAAIATALAVSIWGAEGVLYATIAVTIMLLIFAETTPKTFAAQHAEGHRLDEPAVKRTLDRWGDERIMAHLDHRYLSLALRAHFSEDGDDM